MNHMFLSAALVAICTPVVYAADVTLPSGGSQAFTATGLDQFGQPMAAQPTIGWTTTIGSVSPDSGSSTTLTAPNNIGNGILTASAGTFSITRSIEVTDNGGGGDTGSGDFDPGNFLPISVAMGAPPISGATILFDGSNATIANQTLNDNWQMWPNRQDPISWQIVEDWDDPTKRTLKTDGTTKYGKKDLITIHNYGDHEGHVEFVMLGTGNAGHTNITGRSNSGVYFENAHEIQILDPNDQDKDGDLFDEDLGEHAIGGIVHNRGPTSNQWRNPGEWHVFHWVYRSARYHPDTQKRIERPRLTLWWNGVKVHDNVELDRNGAGGEKDIFGPNGIKLQSNNSDVRFRNFWVNTGGSDGGEDDNSAPVIVDVSATPEIVSGLTSQLAVTASDADDDVLTYSWTVTQSPSGSNPDFTNTAQNPLITFDQAGTYTFRVVASDGLATSEPQTVDIRVDQTPASLEINP